MKIPDQLLLVKNLPVKLVELVGKGDLSYLCPCRAVKVQSGEWFLEQKARKFPVSAGQRSP